LVHRDGRGGFHRPGVLHGSRDRHGGEGRLAILTAQVLSSLGSEANGFISVESEVDAGVNVPVVAKIRKEMEAVNPSTPLTAAAVAAWASAKLVQDAV
jgi:hypothetical protein